MRAAMRHAGAIRLDHVLGLKRLFMIPHGRPAPTAPMCAFRSSSCCASSPRKATASACIVIGEDLGTVPENFRETLARWGLWGYRVMLFEREGDGRFRPPEAYPAEALATFNTHDLPSFRGWLEGHDLRVKRAIGFDPGESDEQRARTRRSLRASLAQRAPDYAPDDIAAVAAFLGVTPSLLVVIALDDILGVREQINIPGTVDQHPNWRRKLPVPVEDLEGHDGLRRVAGRSRRRAGASRNDQPTGTCQISRAYSRMVRSEENQPMRAVLRMLVRHQSAGDCHSGSTARCACQ